MKRKPEVAGQGPAVQIDSEVLRQIRQHAHSCSKSEVCGILIGSEHDKEVIVHACIAGLNASQGGTHVTFTQDTWEHIYQVKDAQYPDDRIVGWYHSHPGFGVFLSEHDTFIHQNFFSSPLQVAWVYDPHSEEEGCFGWAGKRVERLSEIVVTDGKGGEGAGEGKTEPVVFESGDDDTEQPAEHDRTGESATSAWLRWTITILSYISVALLGFLLCWVVFPRLVPVPIPVSCDAQGCFEIDLLTGLPVRRLSGPLPPVAGRPDLQPGVGSPASQSTTPAPAPGNNVTNEKGKDGQRSK